MVCWNDVRRGPSDVIATDASAHVGANLVHELRRRAFVPEQRPIRRAAAPRLAAPIPAASAPWRAATLRRCVGQPGRRTGPPTASVGSRDEPAPLDTPPSNAPTSMSPCRRFRTPLTGVTSGLWTFPSRRAPSRRRGVMPREILSTAAQPKERTHEQVDTDRRIAGFHLRQTGLARPEHAPRLLLGHLPPPARWAWEAGTWYV